MKSHLSICRFPTLQHYEPIYQQMRDFTLQRTPQTPDTLWFLEHYPVFTQGQAGKPEHILKVNHIPIIQSDRGGQVTYHGPGQLMIYTLYDIKRQNLGIKTFVQALQNSTIALLEQYGVHSEIQCGAPGVYVNGAKICSIGLRVRKGCTYHGMSLNVKMDLAPFQQINPCGFTKLNMTQISDFIPDVSLPDVIHDLQPILLAHLEKSR